MIPWWVLLLVIPATLVVGGVVAIGLWLLSFAKHWGRSW